MASCGSCSASITWARTAGGKAAPFDVDPKGEWVIVDGVARKFQIGDVGPYFTSHFTSCAQAAQWRKRK